LQALKVVLKCFCKGRKQTTVVGVAGLIASRMPADVLLLEGGQDHETVETDVIKCTIRNVAQKWKRAGAGKPFKNPLCLLPHAGQECKKVVENTHATPPDKHCKACHMFTMLVSNCSDGNMRTRNNTLKRCGKKKGPALVTRIKSGRKLQEFCSFHNKKSQALLFFEKCHPGSKKTKGRTHP
jgi:hypothetical protein